MITWRYMCLWLMWVCQCEEQGLRLKVSQVRSQPLPGTLDCLYTLVDGHRMTPLTQTTGPRERTSLVVWEAAISLPVQPRGTGLGVVRRWGCGSVSDTIPRFSMRRFWKTGQRHWLAPNLSLSLSHTPKHTGSQITHLNRPQKSNHTLTLEG